MVKFVGLSFYSFIPEGEKETREGYSMYFIDDDVNEDRAIGFVPFKASFSVKTALSVLGIVRPNDIKTYAEYVGMPCELAFDRNKHVTAIKFIEPSVTPPAEHNAKKPNKLGENPQT